MSIMLPGYAPQKQKVDPLDKIVKGLQIAQSAFGIYADYEKINDAQARQADAKTHQDASLKNDTARTNAEVTLHNAQALAVGNKQPTPGTVRDVKYIDPSTGKPVFATLKAGDVLPPGATPYEEPRATPERKEGSGGKFVKEDVRYWDDKIGEFRNKANVKASEEYYSSAAMVEKLADLKSSQADNQIATLMNKLARDNSAPGGEQMKGAGASENLVNKMESLKQRYLSEKAPKLTDEDRQSVKDIARVTKQVARMDYMKAANTWALDRSKVSDMTQAEILANYLDPEKALSYWDAEADAARQQVADQYNRRPSSFYAPSSPGGAGVTSKGVANQRSLMQRLGGEAQAAPAPFDPNRYLGK